MNDNWIQADRKNMQSPSETVPEHVVRESLQRQLSTINQQNKYLERSLIPTLEEKLARITDGNPPRARLVDTQAGELVHSVMTTVIDPVLGETACHAIAGDLVTADDDLEHLRASNPGRRVHRVSQETLEDLREADHVR